MQFEPEQMPPTEEILKEVAEKMENLPLPEKANRLKEVAATFTSRAALCQMEDEIVKQAVQEVNKINVLWHSVRKKCKHYLIKKKYDAGNKRNPYTECSICGMKHV